MENVNRKRSAVWNHFVENGPKKAKCSCSSELSVSGGNVGNLNRHLKTKHPTVKLVEERQQPTGSADPEPHILVGDSVKHNNKMYLGKLSLGSHRFRPLHKTRSYHHGVPNKSTSSL